MGKYEHEFFLKHFKSLNRLKEFRKKFTASNDYKRKYCLHGDISQNFDFYTGRPVHPGDRHTKLITINVHKIDKEINDRKS